jgi:predicted glycogen debranching enzyme
VADAPVRSLTRFVSGAESASGHAPIHPHLTIDPHPTQEWLVTNGLGGYASGTVLGPITRRYHGLLIAALPNPYGRFMTLHGLSERFRRAGREVLFAGPRDLADREGTMLTPLEFRLECGLPVWKYDVWGCLIEKRVLMPYRQNTVYVEYRYTQGEGAIRLGLRPGIQFRNHDAQIDPGIDTAYTVEMRDWRLEVKSAEVKSAELKSAMVTTVLRLKTNPAAAFTYDPKIVPIDYPAEQHRGYPFQGRLSSPGYFRANLEVGTSIVLQASTEPWELLEGIGYEESRAAELGRSRSIIDCAGANDDTMRAELALAADQFLITPIGRTEDVARARAAGEEARSVIAGYHWFTDWGRDTMISLEGLTLTTGRHREASWILRMFAHYVHDGLIPNLFPEGEKRGLYHTADASLWFFHAMSRYVRATGDGATLQTILPKLREIADAHIAGTHFGIHVDPGDGLLVQGAEGYQLTWMDAKVDDWVVTPRRGKAVEINALRYNALCLLSEWLEQEEPGSGRAYAELARRAHESFNRRFWNPVRDFLFDVVDGESGGGPPGNDAVCRPNQLFAISLEHAVLDTEYWAPVVDAATRCLLTPVGLRSLAPGEPDYRKTYDGDLRSRDAAYHQGSVWAWLIGPYIDALAKVHPERCTLDLLDGFKTQMDQACIGSISEIFDAEDPHKPRGCIAQAWSVAEVLRCYVKLSGTSNATGNFSNKALSGA